MRIAVVNWSSRRVGGIEEYLSIVIPALSRAGHEVAFWHEIDLPDDRGRIDVPGRVLDTCSAVVGAEAAVNVLRDWAPDVVYVHGVRDLAVEKRLLEIAASVYFVHTYTGTCISGAKTVTRPRVTPCDRTFGWPCLAHYFPRGCGGRNPMTMWRQFARQSAQLAVLREYTAVLTHSAHVRDEMTRHGVPTEIVAYPVRQDEGSATHERSPGWRLLFAGRMTRLKGGEHLLDALPLVASALQSSLHVTFAGDGSERPRLEARARGIMSRVPGVAIQFTGWVDSGSVVRLLTAADLLVVPSLWPEPFGSVGPAAGTYGVPSAAFNVGGISEWLVDGVGGHLAPGNPPTPEGLAYAITRCLVDPRHYARLRAGARQTAARFTMDRHLADLLPAFERAVESHRAA